jgi:inosine-uridine nucleoside N-ribohydrolase
MTFQVSSPAKLIARLEPPTGVVDMILDTDTYNEIDDQFALVYALLAPERLNLEAVYAAPFHNDRSSGPEEGMEKSYEEILRVLQRMKRSPEGFVFKGSRQWMTQGNQGVPSEAATDLIARAKAEREGSLYVVAIGAPTNVASAIAAAPEIAERIVVVWLGGHPLYWNSAREFNLQQDLVASRVLFDSGVPLVLVPCVNVAEHIKTTQAEMERFVKGRGAIGDYLYQIYSDYAPEHFARSKEIWDLGPIAWLINPEWANSALVHSPILSTELKWSHDPFRHLIREVRTVNRDAIFGDLFRKLEKFAG